MEQIKTNPKIGLTQNEVKTRIKEGKVNRIKEKSSKSLKEIIFSNVFTFFNLVNFTLAFLLILVGSYRNLLFIGVVIGNILIGIFQELKAKITLDKLSLLSKAGVNVIRDGVINNIPDDDLVADEIIILSAGEQIPADAILVEGELEVNESLLTGESRVINKTKNSKLLSGSFVVSGKAKAYVTKVGDESYSGELSKKVKKLKDDKSQIQHSLNFLIKTITFSLIPIGLILFVKEYFILNVSIKDTIESIAGALVSLIPSGLVILTSTVFVISILKLSKYNTLVQNISSTETLARVDVLCLDKTGTITEGHIKLEQILPINNTPISKINSILKTLSINSKDSNETFKAIEKAANNYTEQPINNIKKVIPFSSERKYSGFEVEDGTFIIGAGSFVLKDKFNEYEKDIEEYLDEGDRVLILAQSNKTKDSYDLPEDLKPLAFLIFSDSIRDEAPETLDYFEDQGVELKVISGDDPKTASIISKKAGLNGAENYIDASTLKTDEDIEQSIEKFSVFGRVTPEQKQKFIKALQKKNHVVAMTGDGVNDTLALKAADTSIAMASGSEAARSVANLVLLDSNFSALPRVITEGRQIINNLEKSSSLYLSKTIYSIFTVIFYIFINMSYLFEPIQLTLLNTVTIGIPSLVLALQKNRSLVKGHFFTNILYYALPAALTTFIGIVLITLIGQFFKFNLPVISTIAIYLILFTGFLLMFKICKPFNLLKVILLIVLFAIFIIADIFFGSFFLLVNLNFIELIIFIILAAILFFIYLILSRDRIAQFMANKLSNYI